MINPKSIAELTERIVEEFHPERIILFGSSALGPASEDSDVDLLVIMRFRFAESEFSKIWKSCHKHAKTIMLYAHLKELQTLKDAL
jgi:predicted nucleotidyltransferase